MTLDSHDDSKPEDAGHAGQYWGGVGTEWLNRKGDRLWRRCSDAVHTMWLDRVAPDFACGRVLKTDLFDEAFGDGLTGWFERRGSEVVACDIAFSTARGAAIRRGRFKTVVADVLRLPFPAASFDCIFSDSTLDHFETETEIYRALGELERVLRPGGTMLLTLDNPGHPLVRLRNSAPGFWRKLGIVPYNVGVTCGVARLERLLSAAGFASLDKGAIMHCPRVLLVPVCRWIERCFGIHEPTAGWLRWLGRFEGLGRLPFRFVTGHFVAFVAKKPL
jgi:ubiquinone/menaquinone biosynthesis C-methylase UbiE